MISVQFDDIVYALQPFGGASVYWKEMTWHIEQDSRFHSSRIRPLRRHRGVPVCSNADIFHSSHFRFSALGKAKNVATVHDLNYELGYVNRGLKSRLNIIERKMSYFTADALICISGSTRKDLLDVYPQLSGRCPIHVVHHGMPVLKSITLANDSGPRGTPYVLFVGGRKGYKAFGDALGGFHASGIWRDGAKLICTGTAFDDEEVANITRLGLTDSVLSAGEVDLGALATLYRNAHCLVYSSVHEGFGLPLLEAMGNSCPVIACGTSCIPEIVGDAATLVSPRSSGEISAAILALQDADHRKHMIARGLERVKLFSWDRCAQAHMDIYLDVASGRF